MNGDARTASLIAVGASVAANCQTGLEADAARAAKHGAAPPEIAFAAGLSKGAPAAPASEAACGCGS